ncbi:MAG: xylulokinase [Granulosicoccus sp.]
MYLGIDLGTSGVKTVLMTEDQQILASSSSELSVSRPHDGWSEQDPEHWVSAVQATLDDLKASHAKALQAVRGIGLSGQQHGATLLDNKDNVIRPCLLWNDTRSEKQANRLDTNESRKIIGNILFPGYTSPKTAWVAENEPAAFEKVAKILLPKDYLRLWLTGEHVAEMSDASGTGWLDIGQRCWSHPLLEASQLTSSQMPALVEGTQVSGTLRREVAERYGMSETVVVAGGAGDNAASACGMGTISTGRAFLSLGTSGVLFASNDSFMPNAESAVHTFCHALPDTWHQMGVILAATDALNWLGKVLGSSPAQLTQELGAASTPATDLLFLPYLGGERTPINDSAARAVFVGLKHGSDRIEMTRAVLQGVAFAFRGNLKALQEAGTDLTRAWAIGGGAKSDYWLQVIANSLGIVLDLPEDADLGASLGAARLGLIAAENADPLTVCTEPSVSRVVEPDEHQSSFVEQYERYAASYQALKPVMN